MGVRSIIDVTVAAANFDLTTLIDVLADMRLKNTDESDKAWLRRAIEECSADLSNSCNRVFPVQTYSEAIYPDRDPYPYQIPGGHDALQLARWPITAVTSVTENGTALIEDTDFKTDKATGQLLRIDASGFLRRWCALPIVVIYAAGYSPIPSDVRRMVNRVIKGAWFALDRDPAIRSRGEPGVGNIGYWIGLDPDAERIIDNYRVPVTA